MAPKKKGGKNKKQDDDWEAELGETIDPIAQAEADAKAAEAAKDAEEDDGQTGGGGAGGLMAALRKRKDKKGKKGKPVEDFVEGEDAPGVAASGDVAASAAEEANGVATPPVDEFADKAPVEANMEDEDVFGQPLKKGKAGKQQAAQQDDEDEDDEGDNGGRILTKKEKEKLKKEREKARKKEQVSLLGIFAIMSL